MFLIESQLSEIKYCIQKIKKHFIGIIYSDKGLIACSLPLTDHDTVEKSLSPLIHNVKDIEIINKPALKMEEIVNILYGLHFDPREYWNKSLTIELDYSLYTDKEKMVLQELRKTLPGETISYKIFP